MAITFRDSQKGISASGNSIAVTKPTGTVDNDLLVAAVVSVAGVTGAPVGWSQIRDTVTGATHFTTYYKVASGEGATFTFTGVGGTFATVATFTGTLTASPLDVEGGASNGSATACCAPSITTTKAADLLVFAGYNASARTFTPPAGFTEPTNGEGASVAHDFELAYLLDAGTSGPTGDKSATLSAASANLGHLASFKPITGLGFPFKSQNLTTLLRR